MEKHLLLVDDDLRLRDLVKRYLKAERPWLISSVGTVQEALTALSLWIFDAVILDVMLPHESGMSLLIQATVLPPVLFLSARGDPEDRIRGLEMGALDYLSKPFEPRELILRLENIFERSSQKILLGDKVFHQSKQLLTDLKGTPLPLTACERSLLSYLACHLHTSLSREKIAQAVFPDSSNLRVVDVQINRLRKKIEANPEIPRYLISLRGEGYCLQEMGSL